MITKKITLPTPIIRGDKEIKEIEIQEPTVLALQGLEMMAVIRGQVDQLCILLPRISDLTESEVRSLGFKDLAAISLSITSFLG